MGLSKFSGLRAGRAWNLASYRLAYLLISSVERYYLTDWRKAEGMPPRRLESTPCNQINGHRVPVLYAMSPLLMPRPLEWDESIHMTGFWLDEEHADYTPPPDLAAFLAKEPKPVYIGFGSMTSGDMGATLRIVLVENLRRTTQDAADEPELTLFDTFDGLDELDAVERLLGQHRQRPSHRVAPAHTDDRAGEQQQDEAALPVTPVQRNSEDVRKHQDGQHQADDLFGGHDERHQRRGQRARGSTQPALRQPHEEGDGGSDDNEDGCEFDHRLLCGSFCGGDIVMTPPRHESRNAHAAPHDCQFMTICSLQPGPACSWRSQLPARNRTAISLHPL